MGDGVEGLNLKKEPER